MVPPLWQLFPYDQLEVPRNSINEGEISSAKMTFGSDPRVDEFFHAEFDILPCVFATAVATEHIYTIYVIKPSVKGMVSCLPFY
jgi:hypothetical protein